MMESVNLITFILLAFFCHWFGEWYHHHHHGKHPKVKAAVQRYVPLIGMVVSQPHFWHGVKDYLIHLFVYSGYILPAAH